MAGSLLLPFTGRRNATVIPNSSRAIPSFPSSVESRRMPDDEWNVPLAPAKFLPARSIYSLAASTVSQPTLTALLASPIPSIDREVPVKSREPCSGTKYETSLGIIGRVLQPSMIEKDLEHAETASSAPAGRSEISFPPHRRMTNSILSRYT
jgi:hypothetical protein